MLLCSRNARPRKALVGRAQGEHNRRPRHFLQQRQGGKGASNGRERRQVVSCPLRRWRPPFPPVGQFLWFQQR